jgi:hypothetical protein
MLLIAIFVATELVYLIVKILSVAVAVKLNVMLDDNAKKGCPNETEVPFAILIYKLPDDVVERFNLTV